MGFEDDLSKFIQRATQKHLHLDSLLANPQVKVIISISGITSNDLTVNRDFLDNSNNLRSQRKPIVGFINGDLGLSGANQFVAPLESAFDGINRIANAFKVGAKELNLPIPDVQLKSQFQTILQWTGSNRPAFSVPIIFLAWRKGQSILQPLRTLILSCNPNSVGNIKNKFLTTAPGNYTVTKNEQTGTYNAGGTASVKYSTWFQANDLVITSFSFTIGKETNEDGEPIFATGTVSFEAFKMQSGTDVANWLINPKTQKGLF